MSVIAQASAGTVPELGSWGWGVLGALLAGLAITLADRWLKKNDATSDKLTDERHARLIHMIESIDAKLDKSLAEHAKDLRSLRDRVEKHDRRLVRLEAERGVSGGSTGDPSERGGDD